MPTKGWDALGDAIKSMKASMKHVLSKKIDDVKTLLRVQDLVILSLYEDIPLRLDYASKISGKLDL